MSGLANAAAYLVIVDDLHRPPAFAGVLAAAQGAGSVAGGLLCGRILDRRGEAAVAWWGAVLALAEPSGRGATPVAKYSARRFDCSESAAASISSSMC